MTVQLDENEAVYCSYDFAYIPEYKTDWSACGDLRSSVTVIVPPHAVAVIPTGLKVKMPEWYAYIVEPRSSTLIRKWLMVNVWMIDSDYRGEIKMVVYNTSKHQVTIQQWERLAQWLVYKIPNTVSKIEVSNQDYDTFENRYPSERWENWLWSTWQL